MRSLVSVRIVDSVHPIEGADAVERARVGGWDVVVKKCENYKAGDKTIFFEIDSALPLSGFFGFLTNRSPKKSVNGELCHVVKTAKLRGVVSQGLMVLPEDLLPSDEFDHDLLVDGYDLTEWAESTYGVTKWEPPLPKSVSGGEAKGNFPTHIVRKTDSVRVQNLGKEWDDILSHSSEWCATEKIDGTSSTFIQTKDEGLIVCSRNWVISEGPNLYWDIAHQYDLQRVLPEGAVVQGEIYGEGIQGNRLGVKGRHLAVFYVGFPTALRTVLNAGQESETSPETDQLTNGDIGLGSFILGMSDTEDTGWCSSLPSVPVFDTLKVPETISGAVDQADGIRSVISPARLAEGIVWHRIGASGKRKTFKAISNKYLLREKF